MKMQPDRDLERELRDIGARIDYPPTPDLARAVRNRLDEGEETTSRRFQLPLPALRWAATAAAFLLIVAAPVFSPALRHTVTGWFEGGQASTGGQAAGGAGEASSAVREEASQGGSGSEVTLVGEGGSHPADAARPSSGGRPMPGSGGGAPPSGGNLGYGDRISLREAQTRLAGSELLLPETLGAPDQVYAGGSSRNGGVVLVYGAESGLPSLGGTGVGLVLTEAPGSVESAYLRGGTLVVAGVEEVSVGNGRGYWVPPGRHPSLADRAGDLPGSVLFWERGGLALRLGADLPKQEMIRIAESVR